MTPAEVAGFPVTLRLSGRPVLVVGGGSVATRKVRALVDAGAHVTVVAPDVADELRAIPGVDVRVRGYERGEVDAYRLVVTATDVEAVNQAVFDDAEAAGVWCNSADDPERCSFTLPSVARRGAVTVAVSTGGRSPALAAWLRRELERVLGPELADVAESLAEERAAVHAAGGSTEAMDWSAMIDALAAAHVTLR